MKETGRIEKEKFDKWLADDGPAAIISKEQLRPVVGEGSIVFPPTFAPDQNASDKRSEYVIDQTRSGKICLLDSVGSQANRMEALFKSQKYSQLVPKVIIKAGTHEVNLLDAGHRAADAIVRYSELGEDLGKAFKALKENGDALQLAKIAPTSFVFGAWDSRDTQAKIPRIVSSTIMAYDVESLTRSAQYIPPLDYKEAGIVEEAGLTSESKDLGELGLTHVPAPRALGGIIAHGGIRRECVLNLTALRTIGAPDAASTSKLRRYILGLALVAFTAPTELNLRQGCLLVRNTDKATEWKVIKYDGATESFALSQEDALAYAQAAAEDFQIGKSRNVQFKSERLKEAVKAKGKRVRKGGDKEVSRSAPDGEVS